MEQRVSVECINESFSTTRQLTAVPPDPAAYINSSRFVYPHVGNEGGLRNKGLYKSNLSEPIVTVITVTYNCGRDLEDTILSVLNQSYSNIEYIVVDGGSQDGTLNILTKYDHAIDYWISEPDKGIYDAMNKGILLSSGDWLSFLNAKDTFCEPRTIETVATQYFHNDARFIYSDVLLARHDDPKNNRHRYECDHKRLIINHQASIYRKQLHLEHGLYIVAPKLSISDYLFFSLIDQNDYLKAKAPIAVYDTTGVSQSRRSVEQKFIVDYLLNGMSKVKFGLYFSLYYYYRQTKAALLRLLRSKAIPQP
jgi:glycosyltransferase involved in cell wall biosynthesis